MRSRISCNRACRHSAPPTPCLSGNLMQTECQWVAPGKLTLLQPWFEIRKMGILSFALGIVPSCTAVSQQARHPAGFMQSSTEPTDGIQIAEI